MLISRVAAALLSHLNASLSHQTLQSSDSFLTTHRSVETERRSPGSMQHLPICPDSEHAYLTPTPISKHLSERSVVLFLVCICGA